MVLLERVRRQSSKLRTRTRALVGTPLTMAVAATAPAASLLVTFSGRRLRAFGHARRLWQQGFCGARCLRLRTFGRAWRLRLRWLRLRRSLLPLRALLLRTSLAARALIGPALAALLRTALAALLRTALAALLRAALAATVLVARPVAPLIAPFVAALATVALLGTAFALRLLLTARLARSA